MEMRPKLTGSPTAPPVVNASQAVRHGAEDRDAAAREVVRCSCCSLVQFRTQSERCRRCGRPLPLAPATLGEEAAREPLCPNQDDPVTCGPVLEDYRSPSDREARRWGLALANMVKVWRLCRRLTQREMARRASLPRTYVSRIEHSELVPGPGLLCRIAKALEVSVRDLFPPLVLVCADGSAAPFSVTLLQEFICLEPAQMAEVVSFARALVAGRKPKCLGKDRFPAFGQREIA